MEKTGKRKQRQVFHDAVYDSPVIKNLPGYAVKYFGLDLKRLDMDSFCVWTGVLLIRKKLGLDEIYQAKAVYHLFRNGLIVARYKQPVRGGQAIGRVYTREVLPSEIPAKSQIDREIKKLCGSASRPKNLYKLYEKISMKAYMQIQESLHANAKKGEKAYMQTQESLHATVPERGGSGLISKDLSGLSGKNSKKKDPDYLKALKGLKPIDRVPGQVLREVLVATSRFEKIGPQENKMICSLGELNVDSRTVERACKAFKRAQRKHNLKGPWKEDELYKLIELVRYQYAVVQKPLN